jgi:hypothetical protein
MGLWAASGRFDTKEHAKIYPVRCNMVCLVWALRGRPSMRIGDFSLVDDSDEMADIDKLV